MAVGFKCEIAAARSRCPPLQESVRNLDLDVNGGSLETWEIEAKHPDNLPRNLRQNRRNQRNTKDRSALDVPPYPTVFSREIVEKSCPRYGAIHLSH